MLNVTKGQERKRTAPRGGLLRRLKRDERGNTALVFALLLVPVTIMSFGSLDFYRASTAQANLQDVLDSAALVAARAPTTNPDQIQSVGMAALQVAVARYPGTSLVIDPNVTRFRLVNNRIVADAGMNVTPFVAQFFMSGGMRVSAHSEIVRGQSRVEVAMVLDVTGSMNESSGGVSKIQRLRTAGVQFVDILEQASQQSGDNQSVKISVVPFSTTVRLSTNATTLNTYRNSGWIVNSTNHAASNAPFSQGVNRFNLFSQMNTSWAGCVEMRGQPFDVSDAAPTAAQPDSLFIPYFAPDEPDNENAYVTYYGRNYSLSTTNNYIDDEETSSWPSNGEDRWWRAQANVGKYDSSTRTTGTNPVGYQYGPNAGCELPAMLRLTNNFNTIRSTIQGLTAVGDTNIPLGLAWGWHSVSPNAPFTDGSAYSNRETIKAIVLMTDGNNTNGSTSNFNQSFTSGVGYIWQNRLGITGGSAAQRTAAMDGRLVQLCTNLRAQGVQVYTVRVEVSDGDSTVLQNCATRPDMYYDVQDAADLSDAFRAIAGQITRLRIAN